MQTTNIGLDLIKKYEGLRLDAYYCPAGVLTIGYGHTHQVKEVDKITESIATEYLKKDVRYAERAVEKYVTVDIDQHQFDALVSFIFNLGVGNFSTSTLLDMINAENFDGAERQFIRWNKARVNGVLKPLRGLTRRRRDEAELFANHEYDEMPQMVEPLMKKTMLNSKTSITSVVGIGGLCATQIDNAKKMLDGVNDVTAKGGDIADHLGGFFGGLSWPMVAALGIVAAFVFVMLERKRKIDHDGN